MNEPLFPYLPADRITRCYAASPGNELTSGKFASPESSAALVANGFGLFLNRPGDLPPLPDITAGWPATSVALEAELRFPWRGGLHPWLDVLVETPDAVIAIESKRYEPFRTKVAPAFSEAYWRPVWGEAMTRYCAMRDRLCDASVAFAHVDAAQLVKHAYGLRSAVNRKGVRQGKQPILLYLYAEPATWPDGRDIPEGAVAHHLSEIAAFADAVTGDEVAFAASSWGTLIATWAGSPLADVRDHAAAVRTQFMV